MAEAKPGIEIKPVRAAISGCGGVTVDILEVIGAYPELEIVAVQDINPDAAAAVADRFGIPNRYTHFDDILTPDIEFIIINTPNHLHHPYAIQALKAGKHCTVQKPIARNSAEAMEMIDEASKAGRLLGVTMEERGNVVYRQMKSMVGAGCIGDVLEIQGIIGHTRHLRNRLAKDDWRASPDLIGGGSFMQLGIHHIDLSQWLLDDDIVEVGARSVSKLSKEFFPADETTVAWTHFSRGAVGSFASSFAFEAHMFFIHGTAGHVGRKGNRIFWEVNQPFDGEAWRCNEACTPGHIEFDWYSSRPARIKPEYEQHRRFALAIRGLAELEASAEVGLKDLLVVEAVHKSAAERIAVAVPSID